VTYPARYRLSYGLLFVSSVLSFHFVSREKEDDTQFSSSNLNSAYSDLLDRKKLFVLCTVLLLWELRRPMNPVLFFLERNFCCPVRKSDSGTALNSCAVDYVIC
jgi:hypothetical protein